jgi:hypothetical protein
MLLIEKDDDDDDDEDSPPRPVATTNERPAILNRMISNSTGDSNNASSCSSSLHKFKTKARALGAFKVYSKSTGAQVSAEAATEISQLSKVKTKARALQPYQRVEAPPDLLVKAPPPTNGNKKKKKSSRRKTETLKSGKRKDEQEIIVDEDDNANVLPLTEHNLGALERGGALPAAAGPLFTRRSTKHRSKSPSGKRRSKSSSSRKSASAVMEQSTQPEQQHKSSAFDTKNRLVKIRVIGQVEYGPTDDANHLIIPEEDAPVTASFVEVLKSKPSADNSTATWGALAKELSQGIHSVEVPKLAFTHPTSRDGVISFGAGRTATATESKSKKAILIGGHEERDRQVYRMHDFLVSTLDFADDKGANEIIILLDPSKAEILNAFQKMALNLENGDSLLIYYIGKQSVDVVLDQVPRLSCDPNYCSFTNRTQLTIPCLLIRPRFGRYSSSGIQQKFQD